MSKQYQDLIQLHDLAKSINIDQITADTLRRTDILKLVHDTTQQVNAIQQKLIEIKNLETALTTIRQLLNENLPVPLDQYGVTHIQLSPLLINHIEVLFATTFKFNRNDGEDCAECGSLGQDNYSCNGITLQWNTTELHAHYPSLVDTQQQTLQPNVRDTLNSALADHLCRLNRLDNAVLKQLQYRVLTPYHFAINFEQLTYQHVTSMNKT